MLERYWRIKEKTIGTVKEVSLSHELLLKYLLKNDPLSDDNCENCSCFPICEGGCPYKRIYQKMGWKVFAKQKEKVLSTSSKGILIINIKITK